MRYVGRLAAVVAMAVTSLLVAMGGAATAEVLVRIDKSTQQMSVSVNGEHRYLWSVSTGRRGYRTPAGLFRPQWMARMHYSRKYDNSPMPHSIFFHCGYAIHGTPYVRRLGRVASHGCIRLHPSNAAILFALVRRHGMSRTRIVVTSAVAVEWRRPPQRPERPRNREDDISFAGVFEGLFEDD